MAIWGNRFGSRQSRLPDSASPTTSLGELPNVMQFWRDSKPSMAERQYVLDHAKRFAKTIQLIRSRRASLTRVLDIAGNDVSKHLFSHFLNVENIEQTPVDFNIELDSWEGKFEEGVYELVVITEVIEHMAADPAKIIHWANRLLKADGLLVVSTPNLSRSLGLYNLIHGRAPYHWGVLFASIQDRHQREYAPWELAELVAVHEFDVELLTSDVYPRSEAHDIAEAWLVENFSETNAGLRGDSIFICASKRNPSKEITRIEPIYDGSVAVNRDEALIEKMSHISLVDQD